MKKKINFTFKCLTVFLLVVFFFGGMVFAESISANMNEVESPSQGIFDVYATSEVYKESNYNTRLPFIRYVSDRILVDKDITNVGMMISNKSVEITENILAPQIIIANDNVYIHGKVSDCFIITNGSVIVEGEVDGNIMLITSAGVTISESAKINGDVIIYSTKLKLDGTVSGSVLGTVSKLGGIGKVNKDLRLAVEEVTDEAIEVNENVYFNTYHYSENMHSKYPNALINEIKEVKNNGIKVTDILDGIIICIIFAILYGIFSKIKNVDVISSMLEKSKKYPAFTVISGAITLLAFPLVIIVCITLSTLRLSVIAMPILLVYLVFVSVVAILSTFIVGSVMIKYMESRYKEKVGKVNKYFFAFVLFGVLYILARIPVIGIYVSMLLVMFATGIAFTSIFKRQK